MSAPQTSSLDERLQALREQGDAPNLPVPSIWNTKYFLYPFQRVGAAHLAVRKRFILGDPTGSGKTIQELYAWALVRDLRLKEGRCTRLWVITTKAATKQWEEEIHRFLLDLNVYRLPTDATKSRRVAVVKEWAEDTTSPALISNWSQFSMDWEMVKSHLWPTFESDPLKPPLWLSEAAIVADEIQKIKNPKSHLGETAREIFSYVDRAHGLTATLVKNRAHDAQAVVESIAPGTISLPDFEAHCCLYSLKPIRRRGGGGRVVLVRNLDGYVNLDYFKLRIAHLYLGRSDDEIAIQRPEVSFMKRTVRMSPSQRKLYLEAEQGILVDSDNVGAASLGHAFQASCAPEIFKDLDPYPFSVRTTDNAKADLLLSLLEDDEALKDAPVVIYSKLETVISAYEKILAAYNPLRVTGKEDEAEREFARKSFQEGKTNILLITDAGGEALNLQRGKHLVCLSRPFDPGSYLQLVGRIRRFGSTHSTIIVWHLDVEDSIDEYTDAVLHEKFGPVEEIVSGRGTLLPDQYVLPKEIASYARKRRMNKGAS